MTVVFVDLVGSTELAGRLDPEEYGEILQAHHRACATRVNHFEGHIAQFLGDGVLAYFGFPLAHEDDASRAVRAALAIVDDVARLPAPDGLLPLRVRVGIATGLAVIGDLADVNDGRGLAVGGETSNLAARLQTIAPVGTVVLASSTQRLVAGEFELLDLGPQDLKGFGEPQGAWRVVAEADLPSRFAARVQQLPRLVGRAQEMTRLVARWDAARAGRGQAVSVGGPPGIGKSCLVRSFMERAGSRHVALQCSPYYVDTPFHPVIRHFTSRLGIGSGSSPRVALERLALFVSGHRLDDDALPLLAGLLRLGGNGDRAAEIRTYSARKVKERTIEALCRYLIPPSDGEPSVVLVEDAHWADASTLELIDSVLDRVGASRTFLLVTHRPEPAGTMLDRAGVERLTLAPLTPLESARLAEDVSGRRLPPALVSEIVARADGVPLFIEELTRHAKESGRLSDFEDGPAAVQSRQPPGIPATLRDSLAARLDRLAPIREVAQAAAAVGRECSYSLLAAVLPIGEGALDDALRQFEAADILQRSVVDGDQVLVFKHALVRDAVYDGMLRPKRQALHAAIATAIARRSPAAEAEVPEILARHLMLAGRMAEAVPLWLKAGRDAVSRSALVEAVAHLRTVLDLLPHLVPGADRDRMELDARLALAAAYLARHGWGTELILEATRPALAIAERVGDAGKLSQVFWFLWVVDYNRGNFADALATIARMRGFATGRRDDPISILSRTCAESVYLWMGRFKEAADIGAEVIGQLEALRSGPVRGSAYHDALSSATAHYSRVLWYIGRNDLAARAAETAIVLARGAGNDLNLGYVSYVCAGTMLLRGDAGEALTLLRATLATAEDQGFSNLFDLLKVFSGWAMIELGQCAEAVGMIEPAVASLKARSAFGSLPVHLGFLGKALIESGRRDAGLARIDEGIALAERLGAGMHLAELWRFKAEGERRAGRIEASESAINKAMLVAREQGAGGFLLRCAITNVEMGPTPSRHDRLAALREAFEACTGTSKDVQRATALLASAIPPRGSDRSARRQMGRGRPRRSEDPHG